MGCRMKSYTETGLLERNKTAQEKMCLGTLKWDLGGNKRRMQAGGMYLRTFWVENSEFHRERNRTGQNNLRMGLLQPKL